MNTDRLVFEESHLFTNEKPVGFGPATGVTLDHLVTAPNLARPMCTCGKRFAQVTAPDGTPLCQACALREARTILRARRLRFEAKRRANAPAMAIPKKRSRS